MTFNFVQAEFDQWAPSYDADAYSRAGWVSHEKVAQAVRVHKPAMTVSHVVDLGTGTGLLLPYLKNEFAGAVLTGVDLSENMLEECRKKALADHLVQHNLAEGDWPLSRNQMQVVTASGVLEFVRESDNFIKNTAAILQQNGVAVMTYQPPHLGKKPLTGASTTYNRSPRDMANAFEKAGMEILEHSEFAAYRHFGCTIQYGLIAARKLD